MPCKLCRKDEKLENSHIIPEFCYKPLYDEKHRFHVFSTYNKKDRSKEQKGIREKLLCKTCEQHLSKYECYASKVLFGDLIDIKEEKKGIILSGIDYKLFKLFQLSILWRASVSSHKMFKDVHLGQHEPIIRKMILSDTPGSNKKYCCVMMELRNDGKVVDFIDQPEKKRLDGHVAYRFIFGSKVWVYCVSSHGISDTLEACVLSKEGVIRMPIKEIDELGCMVKFAHNLHHMGRCPEGILSNMK